MKDKKSLLEVQEANEALFQIQKILQRNTCSAEELYALTEETLHEYAIRQRALEYLTIEEIMAVMEDLGLSCGACHDDG